LEPAKKLLKYFVLNAKEHYGETFCVYNVHSLIHIHEDVQYFQTSLHTVSAFQFENYLQTIKRYVRSKHNPVVQIVKRLAEKEGSDCIKSTRTVKIKEGIKDSCFLTKNGVVFVKNTLRQKNFSCDYYCKTILQDFFNTFIKSSELDIYVINSNVQPQRVVKHRTHLLRKCVCLPYGNSKVIFPMLNDNN